MSLILKLIIYTIAASGCINASPTKIERMVVSKMRMADLETSASGYAYNQQQGLPASYVQYTNHGSSLHYDAPKSVHYVSPVAAPVAHPTATTIQQRELANVVYPNLKPSPYPQQQHYIRHNPVTYETPVILSVLPHKSNALAPYYVSEKPVEENVEKVEHYTHDEEHDEDDNDFDEDDIDEDHDFHEDLDNEFKGVHDLNSKDNKRIPHDPHIPHSGHDAVYKNDGGEIYDAEKYSAHGEKGETGYKARHEFDKGEKGEYFEDNHKGHYNDEGGHEKARSETESHYAQHGEEEKGAKGANYGQLEYHKKGYKTSGFHNVYHKDEYKKDTDFYDEDHKSGNFEKYDANDERHHNIKGVAEKGSHHNSGYHRQEHGVEGNVDKGREHKYNQGYKNAEGDDAYRKKHVNYSKNGESNYKKEYGHRTGHDNYH